MSAPTGRTRAPSLIATGVLLFVTGGAARAQTSVASQAAIDTFNSEIQATWDKLRPGVEAKAQVEARAQIAALRHSDTHYDVEVPAFHALRMSVREAPGFVRMATNGVTMAVPARGEWSLEVEVDVLVRGKFGFFRPSIRLRNVKLLVDKIRVTTSAVIDDSDATRPQLSRVDQPSVAFRVRVRGGGLFMDLLLRALSPIGNKIAHSTLARTLNGLAPQLASLSGLPGPIPGDAAPLLTDSGAATPFAEVVGNIEAKIRRDHLPHGTLIHSRSDQTQTDSWEAAYRNGGPGNAGTITPEGDGGDSAIWTGHYLASQAFRWQVTQDPAALEGARHAIGGISALFEINGNTGLLARITAPEASLMGQNIVGSNSTVTRRSMRGEVWVGSQGGGGISRDQYMGVFMGLALARDLIPDAQVQQETSRLIQLALDYLVGHAWYVDEDRPAFDASTGGGFPTFYMGSVDQRLAWLLAGERIAPGKYAAEILRVVPLCEADWLGSWTSSFNLDSYYKFNLAHGSYFTYFRLETNAARWREMNRGYQIMRRYVQKHMNAHFELVDVTVDPSLRAQNHPAIREELRRFLQRNHREVTGPVVDLSGVTFTSYPQPTVTLPGQTPRPTVIVLPTNPLDITLRPPAGDFFWQRGPFEPATPNQGDAHNEQPGIDATLPYWMGRAQGAF